MYSIGQLAWNHLRQLASSSSSSSSTLKATIKVLAVNTIASPLPSTTSSVPNHHAVPILALTHHQANAKMSTTTNGTLNLLNGCTSKTTLLNGNKNGTQSNGSAQSNGNTITTSSTTSNGAPSQPKKAKLSLDEIRTLLREADQDCDGKLVLSLDDISGIATVRIDSPRRKNAFSGAMMAQFDDIIQELANWDKVSLFVCLMARSPR